MNELINFGLGFSATGWETLLFVAKVVTLFLSIMITVSVGANLAVVAGRESSERSWKLKPNNLLMPGLLWTIFWILCQIQL